MKNISEWTNFWAYRKPEHSHILVSNRRAHASHEDEAYRKPEHSHILVSNRRAGASHEDEAYRKPEHSHILVSNHMAGSSYEDESGFSPDGKKFAYTYFAGTVGNSYRDIRIFDFDRCSGMFSSPLLIDLSTPNGGLGMTFSSNSKYLYVADFDQLYQINTDTSDIPASVQVVAINDGYYSPQPPFWTDFWLMYLAANGKIYISSGNSVIDMHYINYPDSSGVACDVQQHALHLPCYAGRGNVNHPNYYLGCDTTLGCPCLITGIDEVQGHDFKFSVSPNPASEVVKVIYLLPQNQSGKLEIFDINGRRVYEMRLPPWSTLQQVDVSFLNGGAYGVVLSAGEFRVTRKLVVMRK